MFIVFEGLDGCGKSSLMKLFVSELTKREKAFTSVVDPGGTEVGQQIRQVILDKKLKPSEETELLLYQASRADLVAKQIKPALKKGSWVISDRFYPSTLAFQGYARGLKIADIEYLNDYVTKGARPDYVIWLDTPPEECQRRLAKRAGATGEELNRLDLEKLDFHKKVYEGYKAQSLQDKYSSWVVLDGLKTPEEIFEDLMSKLGHIWTK